MQKQQVIKMIESYIDDNENVFVSLWSFDSHPSWNKEFTKEDWDFVVGQMEGRFGEKLDESIAYDIQWLLEASKQSREKK